MSIEKLLTERGLTKYQLTKQSGIPKTTISDLCSGKSDIEKCSAKTLFQLSKALNCSMEQLMIIGKDSAYNKVTGKPIDKIYLEKDLPNFLKSDLEAYCKGEEEQVSHLDCLWDELYGSINSALYGNRITEEQARYLRLRYLYDEEETEE